MANINGITIKALKKFKGHEGEPLFQGNVYCGGKKIAFWSQDSWGGPDNIIMEPGYSLKKLNSIIEELYPEKGFSVNPDAGGFVLPYTIEQFLVDLVLLMEEEKEYKKAVKNGYTTLYIAHDNYSSMSWSLKGYENRTDDEIRKLLDVYRKMDESFYPENDLNKRMVKIYRSLGDFIVGEPILVTRLLERGVFDGQQ